MDNSANFYHVFSGKLLFNIFHSVNKKFSTFAAKNYMPFIHTVIGRQILDSRGNPTVEAEVYTDTGIVGRASVPSGASTGKHEAVELRDNDKLQYLGKSVTKAVNNINTVIKEKISGAYIFDQEDIDNALIELDGTENKSNLGANAILAVSLAVAKAAAEEARLPLYRYVGGVGANLLPIPLMNILNGGAHADNGIDIQEFMIVPLGADTFSDSLRMGVEIFHHLKEVLKDKGLNTSVGDEGGFAPNIKNNEEALQYVLQAIEKAGYKPGEDVFIALDAAASEFYDPDKKLYHLKKSTGEKLSSKEIVALWKEWKNKYPIISIEDGCAEDDWEGWQLLTEELGDIQLVGDDLFVTNTQRIAEGISNNIANSVLIKVNQIGTLTETIAAVNMAHTNAYTTIMSHRSGETEDTTIADLAVALRCGQIKTGSASRTDRIAKYNQLLRIEEMLGNSAHFLGKNFKFAP